MNATVLPVKLSFSNAYFVIGRRTVLVDTGMPGEEAKLLRAARQAGIKPTDVSLVLHTHGHVDHAGGTAALIGRLPIPTAVHPADAPLLESGRMGTLRPLRLEARLIKPLVDKPFPPVRPDVLLDASFDLAEYGLDGRVLHTPGHTAGSVSLLLPDGAAIVGDVLMGGYMGGNLLGTRPNYHYFADDLPMLRASLQALLDAGVQTFYVGHGGPLRRDDVARWWERARVAG